MLLPYLLFFLSGAAALVYQVAWARSLSLVFGGSHLAITTVLAVYMGGLALGGWLLGRRADAARWPLRLYGALELGVAAFALVFLGLARIYPAVYPPLARLVGESPGGLTAIRTLFAALALIGPTTLMGGTLPVLARLAAARATGRAAAERHLAFLYGINTLGAVAGTLLAGYWLLPGVGVTASVGLAALVNLVAGLAALVMPDRAPAPAETALHSQAPAPAEPAEPAQLARTSRLALWGVGVSGFCALGYEVLWTRMLGLVLGTSVYSFTIMLAAFLTGIGLGSQGYGLLVGRRPIGPRRAAAWFAAVQVGIGVAALAVTVLMRDLPTRAAALQGLFGAGPQAEFGARQLASFAVAFGLLVVPALLMGVAFPLASAARVGREIGSAVGDTLTSNTVGAILGAALSGFVLLHAFGVERSLQMLAVVNCAAGLLIAAAFLRARRAPWAVGLAALALLVALGVWPDWGRAWDRKFFAIYRNNQRSAFDTAERRADALENTDVLYYFEGASEIISVIRPRGAQQAFLVNGRPEATTSPEDVQCQRTLGHLPMLLHREPRSVFVLGTGTGMTLGATTLHPGVERIVLAEIEHGVLPATRTFSRYNHGALDDPRLHIVFNDGRNFLASTAERFDVITADPIHPWSGGAAYLYTREYFRSVAARLRPGGVAAQWLPIYELTPHDVRTVVRTFAESFAHVAIWLTHYDAELVGSDAPLVLDEAALARRLQAAPGVAADLAAVDMGTAEDFLAYFVAGNAGARAFGRAGAINTDDNLFLEFSAPRSQGVAHVMGDNADALAGARESMAPYLAPAPEGPARQAQLARAERALVAGRAYDRAHALFLWGRSGPRLSAALAVTEREFPGHAPARFLAARVRSAGAATPRPIAEAAFPVATESGPGQVRIFAVTMRIGETRGAVVFVDNDRHEIYAQRYVDERADALEGRMREVADRTLAEARAAYEELTRDGGAPPSASAVAARLKPRMAAAAATGR